MRKIEVGSIVRIKTDSLCYRRVVGREFLTNKLRRFFCTTRRIIYKLDAPVSGGLWFSSDYLEFVR